MIAEQKAESDDAPDGMLDVGDLVRVLSYDSETGIFTWLVTLSNRAKAGSRAGTVSNACRQIQLFGVIYKEHQLAWLFHYGVWPTGIIDHANRDQMDNRIKNLRDTNQTMNNANQKRRSDNTSGFKGVSWNASKQKWHAYLTKDRKRIHLGYFESPVFAHYAYIAAANREFGEYARAA